MADDLHQAARLAAVAMTTAGVARVALALHGGMRQIKLLAIEFLVGATLGVMAAGTIAYWHPDLWETERSLLIVAAAAGMAGALGTRILDVVMAALQARVGR